MRSVAASAMPQFAGHMRLNPHDPHLNEVTLASDGIDIDRCIQRFQRQMMVQALERAHGNKTAAASLLGLNRTTFIERMRRHGLGSLVPRRLVIPNGHDGDEHVPQRG